MGVGLHPDNNIPKSTLNDCCTGKPAQCDCQPNSKKLTLLEEETIIKHILDLDSCGFAPTIGAVSDMANKLLAAHDAGQVGSQWPRNFVKQTDTLKTCFIRPYDRQRDLCEDPRAISSWFELV